MWWEIRPQSGGRSRAEVAADGLAGFLVGAALGATSGILSLKGLKPEVRTAQCTVQYCTVSYRIVLYFCLFYICMLFCINHMFLPVCSSRVTRHQRVSVQLLQKPAGAQYCWCACLSLLYVSLSLQGGASSAAGIAEVRRFAAVGGRAGGVKGVGRIFEANTQPSGANVLQESQPACRPRGMFRSYRRCSLYGVWRFISCLLLSSHIVSPVGKLPLNMSSASRRSQAPRVVAPATLLLGSALAFVQVVVLKDGLHFGAWQTDLAERLKWLRLKP